jgi:phosphoglycerate dehydrogenase-like enzyme
MEGVRSCDVNPLHGDDLGRNMTNRFPLLILGTPSESFLDQIAEVRQFAEIQIAQTPEVAALLIPDAEVILVLGHTGRWLQPHWESAARLKWIQASSTGVEDILFPALQRHSAVLTNSRGAYSSPLAEFVMFCVLYFAKAFPVMEHNRREHRWADYPLQEIRRQTIGIVGFGETGRAISRLATAFGMRVLATKRNPPVPARGEEVDKLIPAERWHELLSASDYVVNTLPITSETHGKFGENEFRAMKATSCFVNVGRGKTVQESTLIRALRENWIAAAGLDVYETEPLVPESELYSLPNVILSPHCADKTASSAEEVARIFVENVRQYTKGEPLRNIVNKQLGY